MFLARPLILMALVGVASIVANLYLLWQNNRLLTRAKHYETQLLAQQSVKAESQQRLLQIKNQQGEFADLVSGLQQEIATLQQQQQNSLLTAQQLEARLEGASAEIAQLTGKLRDTERNLNQAQVVVTNQQRLLKAGAVGNGSSDDDLAARLSAAITAGYPDVSVTATANGRISISIPLAHLFLSTELDFKPTANQLLAPIVRELAARPERKVWVIGHADARPITSELVDRYASNWELSAARASQVVLHMASQGLALERFTVAGKAATEPIRDGYSSAALAVNRRLDIQIF